MNPFAAVHVVLLVITNIFMFSQQIGSVDLTHLIVGSASSQTPPEGCEKLSPGVIADGIVAPEGNAPFEIVVQVISVGAKKAILGSELEAEIQFLNADKRPILIPWGTNPSVIEDGQGRNAVEWEVGRFEFQLKDQQGHQVPLKSLTASLFGSNFSAGSQLSLKPGESILAHVKFKLELEEQFRVPIVILKDGEWQLSAKWSQAGRSWSVKNCVVANAFIHYDSYYHQQNPGLTIQVTTRDPGKDKESQRSR
jgi:hypothetical protein